MCVFDRERQREIEEGMSDLNINKKDGIGWPSCKLVSEHAMRPVENVLFTC